MTFPFALCKFLQFPLVGVFQDISLREHKPEKLREINFILSEKKNREINAIVLQIVINNLQF